jgi:hypothetical protein
VLNSYWWATEKGNMEVRNETADLYRYFDATQQAEFLFQCIHETIKESLPEEIHYLQQYDEFKQFIQNAIEMPDKTVELLVQFLRQNHGKFSARAKQREFKQLTPQEMMMIENQYAKLFLEGY